MVWPDGSVHWIAVRGDVYELPARRSNILRYLGIVSDITQRKEVEAVLREADTRKDEFLATLAHELRNPLAPIRNSVLLRELSADPAAHANARAIIARQLKQMVHLVDDLLDISRISRGRIDLRRERADLLAMVLAAIETSRPLIDASRHQLALALSSPGALMVDADPTRICQVVTNLLNNAARYTPDGGAIDLSVRREAGQAVICVRDNGVGISAAMLPRIFDMFAQGDAAGPRAQGGLGVGLALVRNLVELHGGAVSATSAGTGLGCEFVVRLPLAADEQVPSTPRPA